MIWWKYLLGVPAAVHFTQLAHIARFFAPSYPFIPLSSSSSIYFSDVINLFGFRSSQQLEARTTLSAPWFTGFNVFSIFTIWILDTTTSPKGITLNWSVLVCVLLNLSSSRKSLHLLKYLVLWINSARAKVRFLHLHYYCEKQAVSTEETGKACNECDCE